MAPFRILEEKNQKPKLVVTKSNIVVNKTQREKENFHRAALQDKKITKDVGNNHVKALKKVAINDNKKNEKKVPKINVKVVKKETKKEVCRYIPNYESQHQEYMQDVWSYLLNMEKQVERPRPNYMYKQEFLTFDMRSILVNWLAAVTAEFELREQTFHLSVNYIDRFLSRMNVVKEKLQLLGIVAMHVAGKIEEIYPLNSNVWENLCENTYTARQIFRMEQILLKVLQFDLQPPTTITFIQHMCTEYELDERTMHLAMYLSELILLEGREYLNYLPSKLASASIALSRYVLAKSKPWPRTLAAASGYTLKELSPVLQRQHRTFVESPSKTQQSIQSKYKTDKYNKVALIKPIALNLDDSDEDEN